MADILLNHANIDDAADALTQASQAMHNATDDCRAAVTSLSAKLDGDLKGAADAFYTALSAHNDDMNKEISQGADVLRTMHGLLRDADKRGAAGIG
ncbi:WXG100 family type VII secretion target [Kitasatospora sp. NPDC089797]|uniref:WXG100 family type VII secretion target n=1 Tax=Kitasatospora sp. NPDC089797 TaxID=3155298 RepID=UPI00341FA19A